MTVPAAATGWHRHSITGTVHQAPACFVDDATPVLVVPRDGLEETIARVLGEHVWAGPWRWSGTEKTYLYLCRCGKWVPIIKDHTIHHVARALSDGGAE